MCFPDMLVNDVSWLYMPAKKKQNPLYTIQIWVVIFLGVKLMGNRSISEW
jgi:hypothetical protein